MSRILYKNQQPISDDIYKNLNKCELFNIPTGRGKTFILLDVAKRLISENEDAKVIVSVPNNYLAREMITVAKEIFGFSEDNCDLQIGIENYIDPARLSLFLTEEESDDYLDKNDVKRFLNRHKGDKALFFDDFFKEVPLKDIAYDNVLRYKLAMTSSEPKINYSNLTITNHYYLLSKSIYDKNFNIGDFYLLVDEVHEISNVAEQIMSDSFSIFEYKNVLRSIYRTIELEKDFYGKLKILKVLKTEEVRAYNVLKKESNSYLVGQYITSYSKTKEVIGKSISLIDCDNYNYISNIVKKQGYKLAEFANFFSKVDSFRSVAKSFKEEGNNKIAGVYYSPSKGYPTIRTSIENYLGRLNRRFWDKVENFAGVSATVTSSFNPDSVEKYYGYLRLGMSRSGENRDIHYYERLFPKENVGIYVADEGLFGDIQIDSVYDSDFNESNSPYYKKIVDTIYKYHENKSSLVICGGYKEAKYLAKLYTVLYNDVNVLYAKPEEKSIHTIERFKNKGGILFASRNYGIGVSLEGELLEKLFILKLPYPDYTTKKWLDIMEEGRGKFRKYYDREMLITFMQFLGRLARSKKDKGDIFLLDHKFSKLNSNIKDKLISIMEYYGVLKGGLSNQSAKKKENTNYEEVLKKLF